jgi:sigma-B regulation protein RsbU (phosphoserine phosphatase)
VRVTIAQSHMAETALSQGPVLEVVSPDGSRRPAPVTQMPFGIGRGSEAENHLKLDDPLISRQCAAIVADGGRYRLEDRGNSHGVFLNGKKIAAQVLEDGDVITFGLDDSYKVIFRFAGANESIQNILTRIESLSSNSSLPEGLAKLNLLLEATSLLHSQLPLDSALCAMIDHAISITDADRGLLLEADASGSLQVRLARGRGAANLSADSLSPSQTAVRQALDRRFSVITEDLNLADLNLQGAQSIVAQRLRAVVVIPLYAMPRASSTESLVLKSGQLLGVLYLDSKRPAAFSKLDRQILDALSVQAGSILDNARLVEHERERQRLEQELTIARNIQQALIPHGFRDFPYFAVSGIHTPCLEVGGDYFDVFPMSEDRTAFLIADVSGKGLGAALLTTMLQGALSGMTIGAAPAQVFNHINRFLCEHAEVGHYATMFFGILHPDGHLDFFNAGHPSPLLIRRGEVAELYSEGSFPVGLIPEADYVPSEAKLQPDDTLVLFSDGVTEAADPSEKMFGDNRLRETLSKHHEESLEQLQKTVLETVKTFTRGTNQRDDITLLMIRYRAGIGHSIL